MPQRIQGRRPDRASLAEALISCMVPPTSSGRIGPGKSPSRQFAGKGRTMIFAKRVDGLCFDPNRATRGVSTRQTRVFAPQCS
jgi:hypothetical protein